MQGFIEPNEARVDVFNNIINEASIPSDVKEWLFGMASSRRKMPDFEEDDISPLAFFKDEFPKFVESFNQTNIGWEDQAAFKCRFLFDDSGLLDCFDAVKIASEKNKILDEDGLFMPLPNGKWGVFKPWVANILYLIKGDAGFDKKYQRKLKRNRESSGLAERVRYYLELQAFSGSGHEKQPPSWDEIDGIIENGPYPLNLAWEMEGVDEGIGGIPIFIFPRVLLLPFLVYGIDIYKQIRLALNAIGAVCWQNRIPVGTRGMEEKLSDSITLKWNKENHLHWVFFDLAAVSGGYSILDKVLEDVDAVDIPDVFSEYLSRKRPHATLHSTLMYECVDICGMVKKDGNYHGTTGYLDWLSSQFTVSDEAACALFRNYLLKIAEKAPSDKAPLFRELSYPTKHGGSGHNCVAFKSDFQGNHMMAMAIHLSCWMLKLDVYPPDLGHMPKALEHMSKAMDKIMQKEVTFPNAMAESIRSNRNFVFSFAENYGHDDIFEKCCMLLCAAYIAANNGETEDGMIFRITCNLESRYKLLRIQYLYSHSDIDPEQFMEWLFLQKPKKILISDNPDLYPLKLQQCACEASDIPKNAVIKKLNGFIDANTVPDDELEHRFSLRREIQAHLEYFLEPGDPECVEAQEEFFAVDFARVVREAGETEDSFKELDSFLRYWRYSDAYWQKGVYLEEGIKSTFPQMENLFDKHPEWVKFLTDRCGKGLNLLSKTVNENFPHAASRHCFEKEHLFIRSRFLGQKTDVWKGLKPLLTAFRASRIPMLREKLLCVPFRWINLPSEIAAFFHVEDSEKLGQLRRDMANDLVDKLKPIGKNKKKRDPEGYTEFDRASEGFDASYVEPSPIWRYAYVRALRDLGVKTDSRGRFFHDVLERVADPSQGDPSEAVRKAAKRTDEELNALRKGIAGGDGKKRLYEAFWWLRQAHMLSLGKEIDIEAARVTRIQEWR